MVEDRRADAEKENTRVFVVFHDTFLSGWGRARDGRAFYALACVDDWQARTVLANGSRRTDMRGGRILTDLPKVRDTDHLSVVGPYEAARWYVPGGF